MKTLWDAAQNFDNIESDPSNTQTQTHTPHAPLLVQQIRPDNSIHYSLRQAHAEPGSV